MNFKAGDKVIVSGRNQRPKIQFVAKVYKNGNFVLQDGNQQYKQSGFRAAECGPFGRTYVELFNEEKYKELSKPYVIFSLKKKIENLINGCECEDKLNKVIELMEKAND